MVTSVLNAVLTRGNNIGLEPVCNRFEGALDTVVEAITDIFCNVVEGAGRYNVGEVFLGIVRPSSHSALGVAGGRRNLVIEAVYDVVGEGCECLLVYAAEGRIVEPLESVRTPIRHGSLNQGILVLDTIIEASDDVLTYGL